MNALSTNVHDDDSVVFMGECRQLPYQGLCQVHEQERRHQQEHLPSINDDYSLSTSKNSIGRRNRHTSGRTSASIETDTTKKQESAVFPITERSNHPLRHGPRTKNLSYRQRFSSGTAKRIGWWYLFVVGILFSNDTPYGTSSSKSRLLLERMPILSFMMSIHADIFIGRVAADAAARPPLHDNEDDEKRKTIRLGLINGGSSFFKPIADGWMNSCKKMSQEHYLSNSKEIDVDIMSSGFDGSSSNNNVTYNATKDDGNSSQLLLPSPYVECFVATPKVDVNDTCFAKIEHAKSWIMNDGVDGIAMKPCHGPEEPNMFESFMEWAWKYSHVPVMTFDSDVKFPHNTSRAAYVGTDQYFLGRTMARLLKKLRPEGGLYGLVGIKTERVEGFEQEIQKDNDRDDRAHWYHVEPRIPYGSDYYGDAVDHMQYYADHGATALIAFKQKPMKHENWTKFVDDHPGILFLGTDGSDWQIGYLNERKVDGLIGQLPFDIGQQAAQHLVSAINIIDHQEQVELMQKTPLVGGNQTTQSQFRNDNDDSNLGQQRGIDHPSQILPQRVYGTNLVSYNIIPLELPQFSMDQNLLGGWKYVGPILFALTCIYVLVCFFWALRQKYHRVLHSRHDRNETTMILITSSHEEVFLISTTFGVLMMIGTSIPLSYDDDGDPSEMSQRTAVGVCMSQNWLFFFGFAIALTSLSYLAHGYNEKARAAASLKRALWRRQVDRWLPHALATGLLIGNVLILTLWTVQDPLAYTRLIDSATDLWNREISSTGGCASSSGESTARYLAPLLTLNFIAVAVSCWQALSIRNVKIGPDALQTNDPRLTGLSIGSFAQAYCTGLPMVAVVSNAPLAYYLLATSIIFVLCVVCLSLIFIPKIIAQRKYSNLSDKEQKILAMLIRQQNSADMMEQSMPFYSSSSVALTPIGQTADKDKQEPTPRSAKNVPSAESNKSSVEMSGTSSEAKNNVLISKPRKVEEVPIENKVSSLVMGSTPSDESIRTPLHTNVMDRDSMRCSTASTPTCDSPPSENATVLFQKMLLLSQGKISSLDSEGLKT